MKLVNVYILYSSRFYSTFFIVNQPPENCKQLVNRRHHRLLLLRAERVEKNKGKHLSFKCLPRILLIFSIQGLFLYSSLRGSSYPLILRAYRNIGKPYTMAWQIPLLLYFFCSSNFIFPLLLSSSLNTKISHFFAPLTDFLYSDEGFIVLKK